MRSGCPVEKCEDVTIRCLATIEQSRQHVLQMTATTRDIRSLTEASRQVIARSMSEAARFRNLSASSYTRSIG